MMRRCLMLVLVMMVAWGLPAASANPASDRLRARAADELYNFDAERALESYRAAISADPSDAAAHRGLASALLVRIGMLRGTLTLDSYLGRVSGTQVPLPPPPPELEREFHAAIDRAIALGRRDVASRPGAAQAHYELGAAVGVRATYLATVDGGVLAGVRAAREAYSEHERVLALDPTRGEAGLVVGTYRYVVAALSLPMRWMAYVAGFGGGRERGVVLVEQAARTPGENQADARLALALIYTREGRFEDALTQIEALRGRYPRNRLLTLEAGSTLLRAGRAAEAEQVLNAGIERLAADTRSRMFGEEALWHYRRGQARVASGKGADGEPDFRTALSVPGRGWVHGRAHFELGSLALAAGNHAGARAHLEDAVRLGERDHDRAWATRARTLLRRVPTQE